MVQAVPEIVTKEVFAEHLGSSFHLYYGVSEPLEAKIVEVKGLRLGRGRKVSSRERESFTLLLLGPKDPCLPQKIYHLEHPHLGGLDLFLVPIGRNEKGTTYEAVFAFAPSK